MSLKFGKLVLLPQNNEQKEQILKPTGNSFKFGYYMFCDYIHEHPKAKGIHCEINCDAFGRVIILNYCKEHPINLNGRAVRNKRHLLNGSIIEILDKKFKWFYSTKKSKIRDATNVTPKQKVHRRQMPFSEPSRKKTRGDTYHSFTIQTRKEQFEESDSVMEIAKIFNDNDQQNDRDKENISKSMINITAKDCFVDKNVTPSKKNLSCNRSETVFTSYSPKLTDPRLSKSFSFVTPIKGSPKSQYGTPKSVLSEQNDNLSTSCDLIEFSTPCNKLEKRSMHLIDLTSAGRLKTQRTGSPLLKSALKNSAKSNKRLPPKFAAIREETNCNKTLTVKSALKNTSLKNSRLITTPKKVQLFPNKVDNNSALEKTVSISPYIEEITINSTNDSTIDVDQCSSTYIESVIEISEDDSSKNLPNSGKLTTPTSTKSFSNSVKPANKITPKSTQQKSISEIVDRKSVQRSLSRSALACKTSNSVHKGKITKLNTSSFAIRKRSKSVSFEPNSKTSMITSSTLKQVTNLTTSTPITRQSISFRRCMENKPGSITPKSHSCCNSNTEISTTKPSVFTAKKTPMLAKKANTTVKNSEDVLNTTFSIECPTPGLNKIPDHSFKIDEKIENKASNVPLESNYSEKRKSLRVSAIEKTSYSLLSKHVSHAIKEDSSNVSNSEKCSSGSTPRKVSSDIGVFKKLFNTPIKTLNTSSTVVEKNDKSAKSKGQVSKTPKSKGDNLKGIKKLLKTPKSPIKDNYVGVRELMSTPKDKKNLNLSGVRELLNSPVGNIDSVLEEVDVRKALDESVKESLSTPKWKNGKEKFANSKGEVNSPAEGNLSYLKGVKEMLNTPRSAVSPKLIGTKKLFTIQNPLNDSLDGIQDIFKTPSAKMVMMIGTPKSVNVNTNTSSVELQPALFDPRENMDEMEDIFKTPVSNLLQCTENKRNDFELTAEESFDKLVGRRSIKYSYTRKTISPKKSPIKYSDFENNSNLPKTDVEEWVESVNKSFEIKEYKKTNEVCELFRKNDTIGNDEETQNTAISSELSVALFYSDDENSDFEKSKANNFPIKGGDPKAIEIVDCSESNDNDILKPENNYLSKKPEKLVTPIAPKNQTKSQSSSKSISTESNKMIENNQTVEKIDLTPRHMTLRAKSNTPVLQYQKYKRLSIDQSSKNISLGNIEAKTVNITPRKSRRIAASHSQDKSLALEETNCTEKEAISTDLSQRIGVHESTRLSMCSTPKSTFSRNCHELAIQADGFKFQDEVSKTTDISHKEHETSAEFSQELVLANKNNVSATQKTIDDKYKSVATDKPLDVENLKAQLEMEGAFENFQENYAPKLTRTGRSISPIAEKKSVRLPRKTLGSKPGTNEPLDVENLKAQLEMEQAFENFQENADPKPTKAGRSISPIAEKKLVRLPRKTLGSKPETNEPLDVENLKAQLEMERAFENFQENAEPKPTRAGRSISPIAEKKSVRLPKKTLGSKPATNEPLDIENLKAQLEMERAFENFQENADPKPTRAGRSISPIAVKKSVRLPRKTLGSTPAADEPLDIENLKAQLEMERVFENFQENADPKPTRAGRSISPIAEKKSVRLPRKTLGSTPATDEPLDIENLKVQVEMERAFENFQENAEPKPTRAGRSISPIAEKKSVRLPRKTLGSKPGTNEPLDVENLKAQLEMERAFENFQENADPKPTRAGRSISPIAEKKSVRLPRKTLGSKPATNEPLDVENLKAQLEMERAFENFQEKADPKHTRAGRSISPIAEKKSVRLPRKTLGSKPATNEPLDVENLIAQLEMERAFENFQENADPKPTRAGRSISPIAEKKSVRLPRKTLGSKPATNEPLDVENLKAQVEMERAFENFQENAEPKPTRAGRSISPIAEKKSVRLPRKTLGSKPGTNEPLDVENLKAQLEMERAFENFQENAEPKPTRAGRSISPIAEKKSVRLPRKTLGSKPATNEPLDVENLKAQLEMERAFENFQENADPKPTRAGRSISPIAEKKSVRLPRKTLGSTPATDELLDIENLKVQVEMERAFENFQENAEPKPTRAGRSISPIAEKKSVRLPRKTLGSKPGTNEPLNVENLKAQLEMERAFENFQENADPKPTRAGRSISPIAEKKSVRLPRKTLGSKPATNEPLDVENLKAQLEMERAFENFQEKADPKHTRAGRSISPIAEKKSVRLPRKTLGSKPATNEPLDVENLIAQLEMERAFENFQENADPKPTRAGRSISPIAEKKSVRLPRKTLGSKPATNEPLDVENLKAQLEMERAFENFQEKAEPKPTRAGRSISPIAEKKSVRLPRKTLGSKPATDEPLDIENLKVQVEMERAFENFQENAEPKPTRAGRSISPIAEKKSVRLPRKTLGSKPATDEPLDVETLKAQVEIAQAFEKFQEHPNRQLARGVKSLSPVTDKSRLRRPRKTLGNNPTTNEPLDIPSLKTQLELRNAFDTFNEHPTLQQIRAKSISPFVKEKRKRIARTTTTGDFSANRKSCNIQCMEAELEMRTVFENFKNKHKTSDKMQVEEIGITQTNCAENLEVEHGALENSAENPEMSVNQENIKILTVQADKLDKLEKEHDDARSPNEGKLQDNPDEIADKASPAIKRRRYVRRAEKVEKTEKNYSPLRITRTRRHRKNPDIDIDASLEITNQNRDEEKLQIKSELTEESNVIESATDNSKEQTNSAEITSPTQSKSERVKRKVTFLNQCEVDPSPNIPKKAKARKGRKVPISEGVPAVIDAADVNSSNTAEENTSEVNTKSKQGSGKTSEVEIVQEKMTTRNLRKGKRIVKNYKVEETVHDEKQNQENEIKTKIQELEAKETTSRSTRTRRRNIEKSESESEHEIRSSRRNQAKKILNKESYNIKEEARTIETLENNSEMIEKEASSQHQGVNLAIVIKKEPEVTEETEAEKEVEKNHNLRKKRGNNNKKTNESAEPFDNLETNDLSFAKRIKLNTSISSKKENISGVSKTVEEAENKIPAEVNTKRTRGRRLAEDSKNIDAKREVVCDQSSNNLQLEENEENQITAKAGKTRTRLLRSRKINKNIEISDNETPESQSRIVSVSVSNNESNEKKNFNGEKQNASESIEEEKQDSGAANIKKKRERPGRLNTNIEVTKAVELTDNDTADELQTSTPIRKSKRNAGKSNKLESNESKEIKEEVVRPTRTRRRKVEPVETENHQISNSTNNDENVDAKLNTANSSKIERNINNFSLSSSESKVDATLEFKTPIKAAPRTARRLRSNSVTASLTPILPDEDVKNETDPSDSVLSNNSTLATSESKIIIRRATRKKKNDQSNQEKSGTSEECMPAKKLSKSKQKIEEAESPTTTPSKRTLRSRK